MSIKARIRAAANRLLKPAGLELQRKGTSLPPEDTRRTLEGALAHAKRLGINPGTVVDAGAASGTFELYETFPTAHHLLIEPLEEFRPALEKIAANYDSMHIAIAAASEKQGTITLNVHPDLFGSSVYLEGEETDVNGIPREVETITLDAIVKQHNLPSPYLIKVDVQGAELDVLRGARHILPQTAYIVLETSLFAFFQGAPQCFEVMDFMHQQGFVLYDVLGYQYRLLDGALSQVDMAFVPQDSPLRQHHVYATAEQRARQQADFEKLIDRLDQTP